MKVSAYLPQLSHCGAERVVKIGFLITFNRIRKQRYDRRCQSLHRHQTNRGTSTLLRSEVISTDSLSYSLILIQCCELEKTQKDKLKLKVGRAVNLVGRIDQWGKQCGSEEQVLRGWWPDQEGAAVKESLLKGVVKAGEKGPYSHRLERLVHLELADLSVNAPYLEPHFPKATKSDTPSPSAASGSHRGRKSTAIKRQSEPCADC